MYRQSTIGCLRLNYSKTNEQQQQENQNCVKSELSQFLFVQRKMSYVSLMAVFIIFLII